MRMVNCVIAWYVLTLQRIFHINASVSFLSISFFFCYFFVDFTTCLCIDVSVSILKIKQWGCSYIPKWSFVGELLHSALLSIINVTTGLVQFG